MGHAATRGEAFTKRLQGLGKNATARLIPAVVHAWDKQPSLWRDQEGIDQLYAEACERLKESFGLGEKKK